MNKVLLESLLLAGDHDTASEIRNSLPKCAHVLHEPDVHNAFLERIYFLSQNTSCDYELTALNEVRVLIEDFLAPIYSSADEESPASLRVLDEYSPFDLNFQRMVH